MIPTFIYQELIGPYGYDTLKRIGKIERYYHIYEYGAGFEVEETEDYTPACLKSKQIRALISKQAQFAFGKTPEHKVTCPSEPQDPEKGKVNESAIQDYLNSVLRKNHWSGKLIKGAKDCFIGGKVALKATVSNDRIHIMFVPADGFVCETDIDDVDRLERIVFFYTVRDDEERERQRIWVQKYWLENGRCYMSERITDGNGKTVSGSETIEKQDTHLNQIPAYVILNDGLSGDTDGESDVETVMAEDSWYNRMRSNNLDSLRKGMNQITYGINVDRDSIQHFQIKPGAFWDVQGEPDKEPSINTISNDFTYNSAFQDTLSNLKQGMHDSLSVPDLNLESMKSIITSGKAMKAIYWPLICRCEEKMTAWKPALIWLSELVISAAEIYPDLKKVYGDFQKADYSVTIDNQYPLPEDEDEERTLDMQEVTAQSRSRKSYLMKWGGTAHQGLTAEEADAEFAQIAKEREMLEDSYEGDL